MVSSKSLPPASTEPVFQIFQAGNALQHMRQMVRISVPGHLESRILGGAEPLRPDLPGLTNDGSPQTTAPNGLDLARPVVSCPAAGVTENRNRLANLGVQLPPGLRDFELGLLRRRTR